MNVLSPRVASRSRRSSFAGAMIGIAAATIVVRMMITTRSSMSVMRRSASRECGCGCGLTVAESAIDAIRVAVATLDSRLSTLDSLQLSHSRTHLPQSQQMIVNVVGRLPSSMLVPK